MPTSLLLMCIDSLLTSLTYLINNFLQSTTFLSEFKTSLVKPLPKNHNLDPSRLKNYRQVSNFPFLSKLQGSRPFNKNKLTYTFQSAYRYGHSTETALLRVLNDLLVASDCGKVSGLTLLDLSAVFHTIDHHILLDRLQNYFSISGSALNWFQSYLSDRQQIISVNNIQSDPAVI